MNLFVMGVEVDSDGAQCSRCNAEIPLNARAVIVGLSVGEHSEGELSDKMEPVGLCKACVDFLLATWMEVSEFMEGGPVPQTSMTLPKAN